MTVQHKTLKDEILFILGRASEPLDIGQIYERCTLAEEIKRVSDALWILRTDGKIAFAEGDGRKRYVLATGIAAPAPAGKAGRSARMPVIGVDSKPALPLYGPICNPIRPFAEPGEPPKIDIPTIGDPGIGLNGAAGKTQRANQRGKQVATLADTDAERLADAATAKGLDLVEQHAGPEVSGDGYARAKNSAHVEARMSDERLADAILARLKRQLAPTLCELEAAAGMDRMNVHIHIDQVDVHLGGL